MKFFILVVLIVTSSGDIKHLERMSLISEKHCMSVANTIKYEKNKNVTAFDEVVSTYCYKG